MQGLQNRRVETPILKKIFRDGQAIPHHIDRIDKTMRLLAAYVFGACILGSTGVLLRAAKKPHVMVVAH